MVKKIKSAPKKSIPKLLKSAEEIFNAYIRERDKDNPCISCGTGPVENAGHYYSVGSTGALRYNEVNVNGQCIQCNWHNHGNLIHYRNGLIKKYGESKVLMLDSASKGRKSWSRGELYAIIEFYKKETIKLKNA
jgi:hypothetical protein